MDFFGFWWFVFIDFAVFLEQWLGFEDKGGLLIMMDYVESFHIRKLWSALSFGDFQSTRTGLLSPWSADDWVSWTHHLPCDWLSPRIMGVSAIKHEHVPDWNDNFSEDITGNSPHLQMEITMFNKTHPLFQWLFSMSQTVSHYQRVNPINIPIAGKIPCHQSPWKTLWNHIKPY